MVSKWNYNNCQRQPTYLVEDVVVPLLGGLEDDPGLFEEVRPHVGPDDVVVLVEVDLKVLACRIDGYSELHAGVCLTNIFSR